MSQFLSTTTPRRSAGLAGSRTWRANAVAAHSAGFADTSIAARAGVAAVAGLVTLGVATPAAHAEGSAPAGATTTTTMAPISAPVNTAPRPSSTAGTRTTTVALNVRTGAGTQFSRVTTLASGTKVTTTGVTVTDWTQIDYQGAKRWVATRYLSDGVPHAGSSPSGTSAATSTKASASVDTSSLSAKRAAIVKAAYRGIGSSYVYGGTAFGAWDCSGFTMWAYAQAGISLPRTSYSQPGALQRTSTPQPGDLVLQNGGGHVGIYVGNGMMISALNPREGTQLHPVSWMPVSGYYSVS
ncbi:C40 family peptidase [Raineyella fluvialis]|uniref:SH3 domain-containing protein n=1 Tax=Raineyella fluvialis TaxID=2662261 RepID=A0A5Q2FF83_9ACTN|nr:C40 family peptidase [Raineyella fluvialis]QGF23763.1 SH3 domain-containing protein [Raineyella fluvialis]